MTGLFRLSAPGHWREYAEQHLDQRRQEPAEITPASNDGEAPREG